MRVAVVGATGTIGRPLVRALSADHEVVGVARRPAASVEDGVEWIAADATDATAMRRALGGAEVVYHLVHSLGSGDFEARDRAAASAVAASGSSASPHSAAMASCSIWSLAWLIFFYFTVTERRFP